MTQPGLSADKFTNGISKMQRDAGILEKITLDLHLRLVVCVHVLNATQFFLLVRMWSVHTSISTQFSLTCDHVQCAHWHDLIAQTLFLSFLQEGQRQIDQLSRQQQSLVQGDHGCKDAQLSTLLLENRTREMVRDFSIYKWGFLKQGRWNKGIYRRFRNDYVWGWVSGTGKCLEMRSLPEGAENIQEGEAWYIGDVGWCRAILPIQRWTSWKEFELAAQKDPTLLSRLGFDDLGDIKRFLKDNQYEMNTGRVWTFGIKTVGFAECVRHLAISAKNG